MTDGTADYLHGYTDGYRKGRLRGQREAAADVASPVIALIKSTLHQNPLNRRIDIDELVAVLDEATRKFEYQHEQD